jgi:hypothetical protein
MTSGKGFIRNFREINFHKTSLARHMPVTKALQLHPLSIAFRAPVEYSLHARNIETGLALLLSHPMMNGRRPHPLFPPVPTEAVTTRT